MESKLSGSGNDAFSLIKEQPTEEILTEERLSEYITSKTKLKHYIGFEISGMVHLGTGIVSLNKVAQLQKAGVETTLFLADYHSWINKKLGGDMETIRRIGDNYFKEALRISLQCVGGDTDKVKFIKGHELYEKLGLEYFENVLKVSSSMTLSRAKRSITIMGRKENENVNFAQLIYAPMQAADIYSMGVNIAHGGMDQRKAHIVAMEASSLFSYKPIALHHHLLMGIQITEQQRNVIVQAKQQGNREMLDDAIIDIKMSKSNPNSAIFIHDTEEEIRKKINSAYCPAKELDINPIIDILKYVVWPHVRGKTELELTNQKTKETLHYSDIEGMLSDYSSGRIYPADMKGFVSEHLIKMLEPARRYFIDGQGRKYLEEIKAVTVTR